MDLDSNPDILLVRKHLVEHLGPPDQVFEVRGSPLPSSPIQALHLSYFAPGGPNAPVVFATCGACLYQMKDGRRVEAMMLFRRQPNEEAFGAIHRLLSSFAIFAEANNEVIRIGDVVRAPEDLHRFCQMDAILFLPPVPFVPSFHRVQLTDSKLVDLVWLLPVYEAEATYALEHGPQALMMLFAAQGLDLTEMEREEANTIIRPEDARSLAQQRSEQEKKKLAEAKPAPRGKAPQRRPPAQTAGSYEVQDQGDSVAVVRRGAAKKSKPKPPPPPPQPVAPQPPPTPPPPQAVQRPQRRPLIPQKKEEQVVRFDLGKDRAPDAGKQRQPIVAQKSAPKAAEPPPPPPPPAETPEEAKKKRIEELKAKAQDAARRAAERAEQPPPGNADKPKG